MRHLIASLLPLVLMAIPGPAAASACDQTAILRCIHGTFVDDPDIACRAQVCFQGCSEQHLLALKDPWLEMFYYGLRVLRELNLCQPIEEDFAGISSLRKRGSYSRGGISSRGGIPLYRVWYKQPTKLRAREGVLVP